MSRDVRLYLEDILLACQKIRRFTSDMNLEQLKQMTARKMQLFETWR